MPDNERTCLLGEYLDAVDRRVLNVWCKRNLQLAVAHHNALVLALDRLIRPAGLLEDVEILLRLLSLDGKRIHPLPDTGDPRKALGKMQADGVLAVGKIELVRAHAVTLGAEYLRECDIRNLELFGPFDSHAVQRAQRRTGSLDLIGQPEVAILVGVGLIGPTRHPDHQPVCDRSRRRCGQCRRSRPEDVLYEEIQVVGPFGGVVAIGIHMPDMRHALFFEVVVDALADTYQAVLVAAGQPQELQFLPGGCGIRYEFGGSLGIGG